MKYEYYIKCYQSIGSMNDDLNVFGSDGWELVFVTERQDIHGSSITLLTTAYFRRIIL